MKKKLAIVVGALSAVYMFVPEPTDAIPFLGWIDEGMAGAMLLWSLKTLEVTPSNLLARLKGKKALPGAPNGAAAKAAEDDELGRVLDATLNARLSKLKQTA